MHCLDVSLPSPAENLACDEALLESCGAGVGAGPEVLRFWEPVQPLVVVGYANRVRAEVNLPACEADGVPVLRRISGGGAVLLACGCLSYAVVLRTAATGPRASIAGTNALVLERHRRVLERLLGLPVTREGNTDLAVAGRKVSGNAQRRKQQAVLFHGTFLLSLEREYLDRYLLYPGRAPAYRAGRSHADFLGDLPLGPAALKHALSAAWRAETPLDNWPREETARLAAVRYTRREWNLRF